MKVVYIQNLLDTVNKKKVYNTNTIKIQAQMQKKTYKTVKLANTDMTVL